MNPHFKKRGIFILVLGALAILGLILVICFFYYGLKPVDAAVNLELKISKGQGLKEIAAELSQNNLIKSITAFKFYVVLTGKAQNLKPGIYRLNGQMSIPEIVNLLNKGNNKEINVTIPEGATVKEIDRILSAANIIAAGSLINFDFSARGGSTFGGQYNGFDKIEGFLYPDTYRFKIDSSIEEVVQKFLNNFQEKIWPLISQKNDWYEVLILASVLEKEVITPEDRQLVAGILKKRIDNNIPIQVDATIVYEKCQGDIRSCPQRQLSKNDLKIDSPYNTYLNLGLPPAPIANMSQMAVQAALAPKASSYWYYLSVPQTKETIFSKTLDEHIKNKNKYLK